MENNINTEMEQVAVSVPDNENKISADQANFTLPEEFATRTSPLIKRGERVKTIMLDVFIAMLPAFLWGAFAFGWRAISVALISILAAVASELVMCVLFKKKVAISDLSAAVTGLIVAMCLPVNAPFWMPIVGSMFAIVVVKHFFGGLGKNVFNPAATAIVLLSVGEYATGHLITHYPGAFLTHSPIPLFSLRAGLLPEESIFDLFIGNCNGTIGEVSVLFLVAGGVYLLFRRIITWHVPVSMIGTVAAVTFIFPRCTGVAVEVMLYEILSGALILAAFFMATDPATSPKTGAGKIIFGIGCGLITVLIRYFGNSLEGVMLAIVIMNLTVPLIEKITRQKSFGK